MDHQREITFYENQIVNENIGEVDDENSEYIEI